jgi:tetratricopeptide (TPR) repeat protein
MAFFDHLRQRLNQLVDDHIAVPDAIREDLERGKAALEAGDLHDAVARLRRATKAVPEHATAWFLLGLSQLRLDRGKEAAASLEQAHELRGQDGAILVALAEALGVAGAPERAVDAYKRALRAPAAEKLLDQIYGGLGGIYLQRGQNELAVRELRKAVAVEGGQDLRLLGLLGIAHQRIGELDLARESLSRAAAAVPAEREVVLSLAEVLLDLGQAEEARLAAVRLVQEYEQDPAARCTLARCLLAVGQPGPARQELLRALEHAPGSGEAHRLLAQVCLASHDPATALSHLRTALDQLTDGDPEALVVLRQILELELELDEPSPELERDAERLIAATPEHPLGAAAAAVALARSDPPQACALARRSLELAETYAGRLALGQCLAADDKLEQAAAALRTAVRIAPQQQRARAALAHTLEAQAALDAPPSSFYSLLDRVHGLFVAQAQLGDLSAEVAQIKAVFDRPLLITVMGEFNSGKSTFVNALIGEEIAPMGVTPTTATINVLKYGQQRAARILWRDDRDQELPWEEVGSFLRALDNDQARQIKLVELMYPAEELLRVNVVDTPGLNSMIDAHEQTAREYMSQADAVIWLFSADQAGKQTEQQALELLRQFKLKTVGVLNKIDRLSPEELEQVQRHLRDEFSDLVEAVIPVSARRALAALVAGGAEALEQSRFPELRGYLEQQLFARSRKIKRAAARRRLDEVLARGQQRATLSLEQADAIFDGLDALPAWIEQRLAPEAVQAERQRVEQGFAQVYQQGAQEVLDFVRPRRWALGDHRAAPADRDFLLDLLLEGLGALCERSFARISSDLVGVGEELRRRLAAMVTDTSLAVRLEPWLGSVEPLIQERTGLLEQQVYTRFTAFTRGYLRGGRVDRFFTRELPHLKLEVEPILQALTADPIDLDAELLDPLTRWHAEAGSVLIEQLWRVRQEVELQRQEQDLLLLGPLLHYQRAARDTAGEETAGEDA